MSLWWWWFSPKLCPTLATPWTVAPRLLCPWGFSRKEYWNGLLFPSLGDLPDPGIKPTCLTSPALAGRFFTTSATWEALQNVFVLLIIIWNCLAGVCFLVYRTLTCRSHKTTGPLPVLFQARPWHLNHACYRGLLHECMSGCYLLYLFLEGVVLLFYF